MIRRKTIHDNKILKKTGIFAGSLLATTLAVYLYSPVIGSHADTSENLEVNAAIDSMISIKSVSSADIYYSASSSFASRDVTVTVDTNSTYGYSLLLEDLDEKTDLVDPKKEAYAISSSFIGSRTSDTMDTNTWGYSTNGTDYFSIPTIGNPVRVGTTTSASIKSTLVYFGVKYSKTIPGGYYSDDILFTAVTNGADHEPYEMPDRTSMQATYFLCPNIADNPNGITLTDGRDGKTYKAATLADGNCWMLQNLDISNFRGVRADTNLYSNGAASFTIPDSLSTWTFDYDTSEVYNTNVSDYGAYYNYKALSAGYDAYGDICPAGWRVPYEQDWLTLFSKYDITDASAIASLPINLVKSGMYSVDNGVAGQGNAGAWWAYNASATAETATELKAISLDGSGLTSTTIDGRNGLSIRCVAGARSYR